MQWRTQGRLRRCLHPAVKHLNQEQMWGRGCRRVKRTGGCPRLRREDGERANVRGRGRGTSLYLTIRARDSEQTSRRWRSPLQIYSPPTSLLLIVVAVRSSPATNPPPPPRPRHWTFFTANGGGLWDWAEGPATWISKVSMTRRLEKKCTTKRIWTLPEEESTTRQSVRPCTVEDRNTHKGDMNQQGKHRQQIGKETHNQTDPQCRWRAPAGESARA